MLRIKLVKSPIGNTASNRKTVASLGLRKMQQTVELPDNPSVRGMIHKVKHMLLVEEVAGESKAKPAKTTKKVEAPVAVEETPKPKRTKKVAEAPSGE
jgi:large subunit ribosomal protein L30